MDDVAPILALASPCELLALLRLGMTLSREQRKRALAYAEELSRPDPVAAQAELARRSSRRWSWKTSHGFVPAHVVTERVLKDRWRARKHHAKKRRRVRIAA